MSRTTVLVSAAVVAFIALSLLVAWTSRLVYLRQVRRSLVALIGRREAIRASERAMRGVLSHLATATAEEVEAFASDRAHEDRRLMCDVHERMTIVADDLRSVRLPKVLWPTADLLERAARTTAEESARCGNPGSPGETLDGLAEIDLKRVDDALAAADAAVQRMCEVYKVKEPSVYGGGLYI